MFPDAPELYASSPDPPTLAPSLPPAISKSPLSPAILALPAPSDMGRLPLTDSSNAKEIGWPDDFTKGEATPRRSGAVVKIPTNQSFIFFRGLCYGQRKHRAARPVAEQILQTGAS